MVTASLGLPIVSLFLGIIIMILHRTHSARYIVTGVGLRL